MIVVDASVLATALGDDGPDGDLARARLRGERLSAPELVDLEVASVLRRQVRGGEVDIRRAALALADLAALPLRRAPHRRLLARCWELRDNLTVYDASYVALAEALDVRCSPATGGWHAPPARGVASRMLRSASLSALLCGLAMTSPRTPADAADETVRERFPSSLTSRIPWKRTLPRIYTLRRNKYRQDLTYAKPAEQRPAGEPRKCAPRPMLARVLNHIVLRYNRIMMASGACESAKDGNACPEDSQLRQGDGGGGDEPQRTGGADPGLDRRRAACSDPKLAWMLATFTRLASGEEMPVREKIHAVRIVANLRQRPHPRRDVARAACTSSWACRTQYGVLWLAAVAAVALVAVALVVSRGGSGQGSCTTSWSGVCTTQVSAHPSGSEAHQAASGQPSRAG